MGKSYKDHAGNKKSNKNFSKEDFSKDGFKGKRGEKGKEKNRGKYRELDGFDLMG